MKREEQVLLELTEEREQELSLSEGDERDVLEDEFDREFWIKVFLSTCLLCVRACSFAYTSVRWLDPVFL